MSSLRPNEQDQAASPSRSQTDQDAPASTGLRSTVSFMLFVVVLCPAIVLGMGVFFGALLAEVEGWTFLDGCFYVLSNLTGLATPLTESTPESTGGKVFDVLVAVWSLSLAGVIFGVLGSLSVVNQVVSMVSDAVCPPSAALRAW